MQAQVELIYSAKRVRSIVKRLPAYIDTLSNEDSLIMNREVQTRIEEQSQRLTAETEDMLSNQRVRKQVESRKSWQWQVNLLAQST